ncbi:MAG TPA: hypothetical protein ENI27_06935 [bacterium]|nr:hypothetical protein [bacterium]
MKRVIIVHSLYRLSSRGTVFFFVLSLVLLAVYLLGNFQEFLDDTQTFLVQLLNMVLLAEIFFGLLNVLMILYIRHRRLLLRFILTLLAIIYCFSVLLIFKFLSAWFQL